MRLDRESGCCLGVLAGVANWLDLPVALVRVVFVICVLAWPPFLIGYLLMYFCLDRDVTPDKIRDYFSTSATAEHFRELNYRKQIYRNERNKRIAGVCSGIADYLEVSTFWVRVATLLSLFIFGPFTFWAYVICWFVFQPDPEVSSEERLQRRERRRQRRAERRRARGVRKGYINEDEPALSPARGNGDREGGGHARPGADFGAAGYTRTEFTSEMSELESRLREIEAFMTSKRFRLHCEINRI